MWLQRSVGIKHSVPTQMFCRILVVGAFLSICSFALGQTDDPFSIRVESNLVVTRAQVFRKGFRAALADQDYVKCKTDNWTLSFTLPMSKPYVADADCLTSIEFTDLQDKNFHVFEDGVEQKITAAVRERAPWTLERDLHYERLASHIPQNDFVELHRIWSYTPRGIWRSADLPYWAHFSVYGPQKLAPGSCHRVKITLTVLTRKSSPLIDTVIFRTQQMTHW